MKFTNFIYDRYSLILIAYFTKIISVEVLTIHNRQTLLIKGIVMVQSRQNPHTFTVI